MSISYEIVESTSGKSHMINPKLDSAKSAAIALVAINSDKKSVPEDLSFRESGIHLSNSEANTLCNWLLQNGYGDTNVINAALLHRSSKE